MTSAGFCIFRQLCTNNIAKEKHECRVSDEKVSYKHVTEY